MAKRFFYTAAGLLLLVTAHQLGSVSARADWIGTGAVVAVAGGYYAWNSLGEAYQGSPGGWLRAAEWDLPVPPSAVKLFAGSGSGPMMLVTHADEVWQAHYAEGWRLLPPIPGGPVVVEHETFGAIKAAFR